jgi:hypothetical protein
MPRGTEPLPHGSDLVLRRERNVKLRAKHVVMQTKVSHRNKPQIGFGAVPSNSGRSSHVLSVTKTYTQLNAGSMSEKLAPQVKRIQTQIDVQAPNPI